MNPNTILVLLLSFTLFFSACDTDGEIKGESNTPEFTSPALSSVNEKQMYATTITVADATGDMIYAISGADSSYFSINNQTGEVLFINPPNYDLKSSYTFTATARNSEGSKTTQEVIITILDVAVTAPEFESDSTADVYENQIGAITLLAVDKVSTVSYSLDVLNSRIFNINTQTGVVTFKLKPDYETQTQYSFTATAANLFGEESTQYVKINILDIDETAPDIQAPIFTSDSNVSVYENQTTALTITASDNISDVIYSIEGGDSDEFILDSLSGMVAFITPPDYETKTSYSFTAFARDAVGNESNTTIGISILNIDEDAPSFTSALSTTVNENQTSAITLSATDEDSPITYSISGGDSNSFNVDSSSGVVTFKVAPDYEDRRSYVFTAIATDPTNQESSQSITIYILDLNELTQGSFIKKTEQLLSYDASGSAINDGSIKDDGYYRKGEDLNYDRNDTLNIVTDYLTNRMWQDDSNVSSVTKSWLTSANYNAGNYNNTSGDTATTYCSDLTLGGYTDWRLPTMHELVDLIDYNEDYPATNTIFHYRGSPFQNYHNWTSETFVEQSAYAWSLELDYGMQKRELKSKVYHIRCVRTNI